MFSVIVVDGTEVALLSTSRVAHRVHISLMTGPHSKCEEWFEALPYLKIKKYC